jgi:hypothetical protein
MLAENDVSEPGSSEEPPQTLKKSGRCGSRIGIPGVAFSLTSGFRSLLPKNKKTILPSFWLLSTVLDHGSRDHRMFFFFFALIMIGPLDAWATVSFPTTPDHAWSYPTSRKRKHILIVALG